MHIKGLSHNQSWGPYNRLNCYLSCNRGDSSLHNDVLLLYPPPPPQGPTCYAFLTEYIITKYVLGDGARPVSCC